MKRIISILLAVIIVATVFTALPLTFSAAETDSVEVGASSGTTGDCTWTINNDVLTISGNGKMPGFSSGTYDFHPYISYAPWGYSYSSIKKVIIENGVTGIGNNAFSGFENLKNITISNSVTYIGDNAFLNCRSLTNIIIPDSVKSIGFGTFDICTSLESVTIPDSVTSIGGSAFSHCNGLTSVHISDLASWCKIQFADKGSNPLYYAHNLYLNKELVTDIVISDSVTSIGRFAFCGCTSLTSVTIPDSVTSIASYAFSGCTSLTSITIPNSVTSIDYYAYDGCTNLSSITIDKNNPVYDTRNNCNAIIKTENNTLIIGCKTTVIPDSVTCIGGRAFQNCTSLTDITIPDSVTSIGWYAFSGCTNLTSITISNSVTSIGEDVFSYCKSLTNITIPDGVTSIGAGAFYNCTNLSSITIPNSVITIEDDAFSKCDNLTMYVGYGSTAENYARNKKIPFIIIKTSSTIGNCMWTLDEEGTLTISGDGPMPDFDYYSNPAPWSNNGISKVIIEEGITSIGNSAFENCSKLVNVSIPDSVTIIGDDAFLDCKYLSNLIIPEKVTSIGNDAFNSCWYLSNITIPENVTSIGVGAFYNCTRLTSITIPDSVTSIGSYAFEECTNLENITIPDSVMSIGEFAFYDTAWYNNQPDGLIYAGNIAYEYKGTMSANTSISLKDGTKGITSYAFYDCTGLTSITIPDSVTNIGNRAFYGCTSLTSVTIPDSVTSIDKYAFGYIDYYYDYEFDEECYIPIEDFIIYGNSGTEAERYANDNEFNFLIIGETHNNPATPDEPIPDEPDPNEPKEVGDANGDGVTDVLDSAIIQKYAAEKLEYPEKYLVWLDVNNDGAVDILDAADIQKFAAGIITEFKKKG